MPQKDVPSSDGGVRPIVDHPLALAIYSELCRRVHRTKAFIAVAGSSNPCLYPIVASIRGTSRAC